MRYVILAPVYLIIWGAILFPIVSSIYGLVKWRGGWRRASAIPLLVLALFFTPILATSQTSWGLVFIPVTMLLSAYSGVVVLLHRKQTSVENSTAE